MDCMLSTLARAVTALCFIGLCASVQAQGQKYQWVDDNGNVVYGDSPQWAGARLVGVLRTEPLAQAEGSSTSAAAQQMSSQAVDEQALAEALTVYKRSEGVRIPALINVFTARKAA